jgi:hypothetical protein
MSQQQPFSDHQRAYTCTAFGVSTHAGAITRFQSIAAARRDMTVPR